MKTIKLLVSKVLPGSLMVLVMAFNLIPAAPVYASSPADTTTPPQATPQGAKEQKPLDEVFKAQQKAHDHQQEMISKAQNGSGKISELIARAKENGKNTADLEKALATFNTRIGEIRLTFDQTGKLIKDHSGFDATGKITDATLAAKTVEAVHKGNQEVRVKLAEAVKDLKAAGDAYKKANPRPTPTAKPNPS